MHRYQVARGLTRILAKVTPLAAACFGTGFFGLSAPGRALAQGDTQGKLAELPQALHKFQSPTEIENSPYWKLIDQKLLNEDTAATSKIIPKYLVVEQEIPYKTTLVQDFSEVKLNLAICPGYAFTRLLKFVDIPGLQKNVHQQVFVGPESAKGEQETLESFAQRKNYKLETGLDDVGNEYLKLFIPIDRLSDLGKIKFKIEGTYIGRKLVPNTAKIPQPILESGFEGITPYFNPDIDKSLRNIYTGENGKYAAKKYYEGGFSLAAQIESTGLDHLTRSLELTTVIDRISKYNGSGRGFQDVFTRGVGQCGELGIATEVLLLSKHISAVTMPCYRIAEGPRLPHMRVMVGPNNSSSFVIDPSLNPEDPAQASEDHTVNTITNVCFDETVLYRGRGTNVAIEDEGFLGRDVSFSPIGLILKGKERLEVVGITPTYGSKGFSEENVEINKPRK